MEELMDTGVDTPDEKIVPIEIRRGQTELRVMFEDFMVDGDSWICGGFARWACSEHESPVKPGDLDIFCRDQATFAYIAKCLDQVFTCHNDNAVCRTYGAKKPRKQARYRDIPAVQLIKPQEKGAIVTQGTLDDILLNFDFTVTRVGIQAPDVAMASSLFLEHDKKMVLDIRNIHCPISSTFRVIKYVKKGYRVSVPQVLKLFVDWEERDDDYRNGIKNALTKQDPSQEEIDELEALLRVD